MSIPINCLYHQRRHRVCRPQCRIGGRGLIIMSLRLKTRRACYNSPDRRLLHAFCRLPQFFGQTRAMKRRPVPLNLATFSGNNKIQSRFSRLAQAEKFPSIKIIQLVSYSPKAWANSSRLKLGNFVTFEANWPPDKGIHRNDLQTKIKQSEVYAGRISGSALNL